MTAPPDNLDVMLLRLRDAVNVRIREKSRTRDGAQPPQNSPTRSSREPSQPVQIAEPRPSGLLSKLFSFWGRR